MSKKSIFETNFDRLLKLNILSPEGNIRPNGRSKSSGYMDLVLKSVQVPESISSGNCIAISMAHYFSQNGDLCCDPDMVLLIYPEMKAVEAYSFQMAIPPLYQVVYPEPGRYVPRFKKELNSFLRYWLTNLINQNHGTVWENNSE